MGRDAAKSTGNPWRDARLRAAQWNEKLNSREGVEEDNAAVASFTIAVKRPGTKDNNLSRRTSC